MAHTQKPDFFFRAKRTSPFISAEASVQSTAGSRGVRISGSNAGYTMFRGSVKSTGYPLYSPVSPPLPLPCVTMCHHISTGLYLRIQNTRCYNHTKLYFLQPYETVFLTTIRNCISCCRAMEREDLNGVWFRTLPGPMNFDLGTGPLCPMFCY